MRGRKNVVSLAKVRGSTNPDLIRSLRALCHKAETGQITSGAYVTVAPSGHVGTAWDAFGLQTHHLVSGAAMLQHRIVSGALDGE